MSNTIDIMDIDTSVTVVKRNVVYDKAGKKVDIFVSDVNVRERDEITIINDIQKDLEYLQL